MNIVFCLPRIISFAFLFLPVQQYQHDRDEIENQLNYITKNIDRFEYSNAIDADLVKEVECTTTFNGDVKTYSLRSQGSEFGKAIWISRKSGRARAKYFAHSEGDLSVTSRYNSWKRDRSKGAILKSSGAYATGWNNTDIPVGLTVDNGVIVNRLRHKDMDGLVIVYATGGIVVSNIEDGDLYLGSLNKRLNLARRTDLTEFLTWAEKESATVFQMHLMAYKNEIRIDKITSSSKIARRKLLTLAKSSDGELFHTIYYLKNVDCTLYDATEFVFNHIRYTKGMDIIAMVNLDTGLFDILNTEGSTSDCQGEKIWGTSGKEKDMTNILTYSYD